MQANAAAHQRAHAGADAAFSATMLFLVRLLATRATAAYGGSLSVFFIGHFKVAYGLHIRGWSGLVDKVCAALG